MISMASYFSNGTEMWSIIHESDKGLEHLEVSGNLPDCFEDIKSRLLAQLNADGDLCDYIFDVPAEVCKTITGFRHDDVIEDEYSNPFTAMERLKPVSVTNTSPNNIEVITNQKTTKPWWQFW
jgi:hypothetical protein